MTVHVWRAGAVVAYGHLDGGAVRHFLSAGCVDGDRVTVRLNDGRQASYTVRERSLQRCWNTRERVA